MQKIIIGILIVFFNLSLFAQDGPKVVVFNAPEEDNKENKVADYKNLVKLSLLEAFSGDISFYYERILKPNLSFEAGLGLTVDDYLAIMLDNLDYDNTDRTALIGSSFGLGLRYYPFMASEEFYFAPEFKFRYYHNTYNPYGTSAPVGFEPLEEKKVSNNFRITVGYVYFFDKNIFIDYFGGIGLNSTRSSYYTDVYDGVTQTYTFIEQSKTAIKPRLSLGVKLGFVF